MADPPLRESVADPPLLSSYRRFWAGATPWARFLLPGHQQGEAIHQTRSQPGVYEFGASLPQSPATVVPLYVGKSSNVRSRHLAYLATGDHLKELMLPALDQGCTVWQRVRYLVSCPTAACPPPPRVPSAAALTPAPPRPAPAPRRPVPRRAFPPR